MRNLWQALSIFGLLASASCREQTAAASREWWHGLVGAFAGAVVFLFVGYAFVTTDADLREGHLRPYQSNYLALWATHGEVVGGLLGYFLGHRIKGVKGVRLLYLNSCIALRAERYPPLSELKDRMFRECLLLKPNDLQI